ncbi:hypothetical protein ACVWQX_08105 [Neisseria meningitidis]
MAVVLFFRKGIQKLDGSQELGTYCIYLFFVVIGVPASIPLIIKTATTLCFYFDYCGIEFVTDVSVRQAVQY